MNYYYFQTSNAHVLSLSQPLLKVCLMVTHCRSLIRYGNKPHATVSYFSALYLCICQNKVGCNQCVEAATSDTSHKQ